MAAQAKVEINAYRSKLAFDSVLEHRARNMNVCGERPRDEARGRL
jgi:hypothetical protein